MPETPFNIALSVSDVEPLHPCRPYLPSDQHYTAFPTWLLPTEPQRSHPEPRGSLGVVFDDEKYILLTTFRRDGTPVPTPVWVVPLDDGKLGLWTSSGSGKVKRLAHTDRVTVQSCNARGRIKPGTAAVDATAVIVHGPQYEAIQALVQSKYGIMTSITKLLGAIGGVFKGKRVPYGDCGVVIVPAA
jgi:PPOX class probable F420-dependent enzyme